MNRLQLQYQEKILPELQKELKLSHPLAVPRLKKIVVSTSFFEKDHQDEAIKKAASWMAMICGQQPVISRARQSIAGFNLREGNELGLKVTLRQSRMWDFWDKFVNIVLARVKDFQGVSRDSFDGNGNCTIGLTEQIVFPEVDYDSIGKIRGLQVTIITSTSDDRAAELLLEKLGLPYSDRPDFSGQKNRRSARTP